MDVLLKPDLETIESISIDYAIMQKEENIAVLPFGGEWSNAGRQGSLWRLISDNVADQGEGAVLISSSNVFVQTNGRTIAGIGLEDLIIVDDDNETLIVRKGENKHLKAVIDQLKSFDEKVATEHSFEYRPQGMFENLLDNAARKVRRLTVDPGHHMSLQHHHKRSKHRVVVAGTATVQLGDDRHALNAGHSIDICSTLITRLATTPAIRSLSSRGRRDPISARMISFGSTSPLNAEARRQDRVLKNLLLLCLYLDKC